MQPKMQNRRPSWTLLPLGRGEAGVWRTIGVMRNAIRRQAADPTVRETAHAIVLGCGPTDSDCRARRIVEWVRRRLAYVPDPIGVEAVALATSHLRRIAQNGVSQGDCDDATVLLGTLARAVGLPVRITVASFRTNRRLHHVWPDLMTGAGWQEADVFRSERFNLSPSRIEHANV